jgi:hypothetical protein
MYLKGFFSNNYLDSVPYYLTVSLYWKCFELERELRRGFTPLSFSSPFEKGGLRGDLKTPLISIKKGRRLRHPSRGW